MNHADYLVDLVNQNGWPIGTKPRGEIDKLHDLYNGVYTLLITPDKKVVLGEVPVGKLYSGQLGVTAATIRRHGETPSVAAYRALVSELGSTAFVQPVGEKLFVLSDGRQAFISVFMAQTPNMPTNFRRQDVARLVPLSAAQVDKQLPKCAPSLQAIWQEYRQLWV